MRGDGGPQSGVSARCANSDAGALTDSTGAFAFTAQQYTCGIASGGIDCGQVGFTLNGAALVVKDPTSDAGVTSAHAGNFKGGSCVLVAP